MLTVFPDYYEKFKCIADKCKHNCCIGWEIDIDGDTLCKYKNMGGTLGVRLEKNIEYGEAPHFILGENERCPFLNEKNLCDIIIGAGEEALCDICRNHPRFINEIPGRTEIGVGMACEEAARLILGQKWPAVLIGSGKSDDEIINLRDGAVNALQNREKNFDERIKDMLSLCSATFPEKTLGEWADILLSLERLDEKWTELLESLKTDYKNIDFNGFAEHMGDRCTEYEQLTVYLLYRHFANSPDTYEAAARAAFAVLGYLVVYSLGALLWTKQKEFTFEEQVELCRLFSSEIEYSDENVYILLDELY